MIRGDDPSATYDSGANHSRGRPSVKAKPTRNDCVPVSIDQGRVGRRGCRTRKPWKRRHLRGPWRARVDSNSRNGTKVAPKRSKTRKTSQNSRPRACSGPPSTTVALAGVACLAASANLPKNTRVGRTATERRGPDRCQVPSPLTGTTRPWRCAWPVASE